MTTTTRPRPRNIHLRPALLFLACFVLVMLPMSAVSQAIFTDPKSGLCFDIDEETKTASVKNYENETLKENCIIPSSITYYNGEEYAVTSISVEALKDAPISQLNIPSSITKINHDAFLNCKQLEKVTIADGVEEIKDNIFKGCIKLTEITIPKTVKRIGYGFLEGCSSLNTVTFAEGFKPSEMRYSSFYGCDNLTTVNIPGSFDEIPRELFYKQEKLENVNLSEGVVTIGAFAFNSCKALKNINIPTSLKGIGMCAFAESGLENITFAESSQLENIDVGCFKDTNLRNISLPANVNVIWTEMFRGCQSLTHISIPSSILKIDMQAFQDSIHVFITIEQPKLIRNIRV